MQIKYVPSYNLGVNFLINRYGDFNTNNEYHTTWIQRFKNMNIDQLFGAMDTHGQQIFIALLQQITKDK